ncbi:CUB and sushi domain-containing protein 1-like isoform X1 [Oryzias latipes]|uniref:CUB and sushi domain-containing protein 1-like isoform X1 n=1 Tax=Oryzias latipes TaxID=8090 RepID=UPI0009DA9DF1|nr:CUB and sushi domain-containing protein 1-like isoform X1 [Oryzias latipes]
MISRRLGSTHSLVLSYSVANSQMHKHIFCRESWQQMIFSLLLLLMFVQRGISQLPDWNAELEVSGETEWTPQPEVTGDTYWSGSAPLCVGGCKARHREVRRDRCGNSNCCWLGYKSLCRGLLSSAGTDGGAHLQRSYPYSKWQFSSSSLCAPVNCGRPGVDYNGVLYGNDWWVGSVVRYTCRSGFMLMGNPTSLCQPNGLWTPKPSCLRMCQRGSIEVSERELNGTCNSTCADKSYFGPPKLGCTRIDNCKKKESGWKRFFAQCVPCICDCSLSCVSARESLMTPQKKRRRRF